MKPKYLDLSAKVIVKSEEIFGNVPKPDLQSDANQTKKEESTKKC
jgi:hypothetical protein